jgi:hypothetical protein
LQLGQRLLLLLLLFLLLLLLHALHARVARKRPAHGRRHAVGDIY